MTNKRKLNAGIMHMVYAVECPHCGADPLMRCANGKRVLVGGVHWSRFDAAIAEATELFRTRQIDTFNERLYGE